jgi:hypothetical protein
MITLRSQRITVQNEVSDITALMPGVAEGGAPVNGDLLTLTLGSDGNGLDTTTIAGLVELGWEEVPLGAQASANMTFRVYEKIAEDEPTEYVIDTGPSGVSFARIRCWNPNGGVPVLLDCDLVPDEAGTNAALASPATDVEDDEIVDCEWYADSVRTVATPPADMTIMGTDSSSSMTSSAWQHTPGQTAGYTRTLTFSAAEQLAVIRMVVWATEVDEDEDELDQPAAPTDASGEAAGAFRSTIEPTAPATYEIRRITATIDGVAAARPAFVFVESP